MRPEPSLAAPQVGQRPRRRLAYETPEVVWEQPLEIRFALMAGCAKAPADGVACVAANFS